MVYYAHTKEDRKTGQTLSKENWQLLKDHLVSVSKLTGERALKFHAEKLGNLIGLAHDLGKYSDEFQKRLAGVPVKVDHSTAGAQEVLKKYGELIGKATAFTISGHHGGLPDGNKGKPNNLPERLNKNDLPDYYAYKREIELTDIKKEDLIQMPKGRKGMEAFSFSFSIRMLYSCLVDADFLDTEHFMSPDKHGFRPKYVSIQEILKKFELKINELNEKTRKNPTIINLSRQQILERCIELSDTKPGFFTLTVPTGGGKTYSSLAFALKHAVKYKKERIIYVVPYTSIIEQNAAVFREALGENDIVLEHHCNYEYPEGNFDEWDNNEKTHRLATENWDMPIIITTAVQFFESLYANNGSRCRKLHNIVNSVIILDEAQMMPIEYMKPCLWALTELVVNYGVTVVFCTATQPAIGDLIPGGLVPVEIIKDPQELQKKFKRVKVEYYGEMKDDEIAQVMLETEQILTIVNTRKHARILFDKLRERESNGIYHLSARMCPVHRREVFTVIRDSLKKGMCCKVVSTQLIEAGVDVDFPVVYRSAAGIDSIAQAAGRCNREGKRKEGLTYIFEPESHGMPQRGRFSATAAMTRSTLRRIQNFNNDVLSLEAIEDYFKQLLQQEKDSLDAKGIIKLIQEGSSGLAFPYARISHEFQMIDSPMIPIIIPFDTYAEKLILQAEYSSFPMSQARGLQPYTVQIYQHELLGLEKERAIKTIGNSFRFLSDMSFYDNQYGLKDSKEVVAPSEILIY